MTIKLNRTIFLTLLLTLVSTISIQAQEPGTAGTSDSSLILSADTKPVDVVHFEDLQITPSTCLAGTDAEFDISFKLPQRTFLPITKGTFTFTFPSEFDLDYLYQAEIIEQTGALEIAVESFEIYGNQVSINFRSKLNNSSTYLLTSEPPDSNLPPLEFDIMLLDVVNANRPDDYFLSGLTVKWRNKLVAGPDLSEPFEICSPELAEIRIDPAVDLTVPIGDSIVFIATAFDQQGNEITGIDFSWTVISESDSAIGFMTGSVFYATTDGEGRVQTSANGISALSGLITVSSTIVSTFEITEDGIHPDTVYPDEPFPVSFDVTAIPFDDSAAYTIFRMRFEPVGGSGESISIVEGRFDHERISDDLIRYSDLPGLVATSYGLSPGWYHTNLTYYLFVDGTRYGLRDNQPDSVYLLPKAEITYIQGTFSPTTVPAGVGTQFSFGINLNSEIPLTIYPGISSLTLSNQSFTGSASLLPNIVTLNPGTNTITSQPIAIPASETGNSLAATLNLQYSALALSPSLSTAVSLDSVAVDVVDRQGLQIVSTSVIAPNRPKVNYGQDFVLRVGVYNPGTETVSNVDVLLSSDGASSFAARTTIAQIASGATVEIDIPVTTSDISGAEIFQTSLDESQVVELPAIDNTALAEVQSPAKLRLDFSLIGIDGGAVGTNNEFGLIVEVVNDGEASASTGSFALSTGGVDFGIDDPTTGEFVVDDHLNFNFNAPSKEIAATFTFEISAIPTDLNTIQPAIFDSTSFTFEVRVESLNADLLVQIEPLGSSLILPGRQREMFELSLTNLGKVSSASIALEQIRISLTELAGETISSNELLETSTTGFYEEDELLTIATFGSGQAVFSFDQFELSAGEERVLTFAAEIKRTGRSSFVVSLESEDFDALFVDGPSEGESPKIITRRNRNLAYSRTFAIKSQELNESFVIRDNPFNPDAGPAVFSYELSQPSSVDFRVFTVTGEEVYAADFPQGSAETALGENFIEWLGANNNGDVVRNGIYIAVIQVNSTGEQARLKVAVVR